VLTAASAEATKQSPGILSSDRLSRRQLSGQVEELGMRVSIEPPPAEELLAVCDARGQPLAAGRPRGLVHREGVWHRSFHCWIVRGGERSPELVLQRRAQSKDTHPGAWDVSAAGHYRPGEGLEGGLRELQEELGLALRSDALVWVERHREVLRYPDGLRDREYQDVYLARCEQSLRAYAPDPGEVDGLAVLPAATLVGVARGHTRRARAHARVLAANGWRDDEVVISRATLVPRMGRYYERIARAAARALETSPTGRAWR
jgi:isopentenyldiphosphate isomerase